MFSISKKNPKARIIKKSKYSLEIFLILKRQIKAGTSIARLKKYIEGVKFN
jgi:hypothetical protein